MLSDHGEEFGDHGRWSHGLTLCEEQLRVPLVVKWPRGWKAGRREEQPVWTGYLGSLLKITQQRWTARTTAEEVELDSDLRKELKALGYLQ